MLSAAARLFLSIIRRAGSLSELSSGSSHLISSLTHHEIFLFLIIIRSKKLWSTPSSAISMALEFAQPLGVDDVGERKNSYYPVVSLSIDLRTSLLFIFMLYISTERSHAHLYTHTRSAAI